MYLRAKEGFKTRMFEVFHMRSDLSHPFFTEETAHTYTCHARARASDSIRRSLKPQLEGVGHAPLSTQQQDQLHYVGAGGTIVCTVFAP